MPFRRNDLACGRIGLGHLGNERKFPRQLAMLGLTILGVVAIALALPVTDSTRNRVLGLVGLVISGMFAFSDFRGRYGFY